jgi:hypothetical protein
VNADVDEVVAVAAVVVDADANGNSDAGAAAVPRGALVFDVPGAESENSDGVVVVAPGVPKVNADVAAGG